MRVYVKHTSQDLDHQDEMERILDYLNKHGTLLVNSSTVKRLYHEFSEYEHWVRWGGVPLMYLNNLQSGLISMIFERRNSHDD